MSLTTPLMPKKNQTHQVHCIICRKVCSESKLTESVALEIVICFECKFGLNVKVDLWYIDAHGNRIEVK